MVAKGQARIRVQLSAAHEQKHLDKAIAAFTKVGKELGMLKWRATFNFCIFTVMETIIVKPESPEQIKTVKAFLNALKIKFKEETVSPYKPEFAVKIKQGEKEKKWVGRSGSHIQLPHSK